MNPEASDTRLPPLRWQRASAAKRASLGRADIVGGLILGVGITNAGACPGTLLDYVGAGYKASQFVTVDPSSTVGFALGHDMVVEPHAALRCTRDTMKLTFAGSTAMAMTCKHEHLL